MGDEEIVGATCHRAGASDAPLRLYFTSYLELSNSKLITATDVEKELCYQLTTGWGDGINVYLERPEPGLLQPLRGNFFGGVRRTPGQDAPPVSLCPGASGARHRRGVGWGAARPTSSRSARGRALCGRSLLALKHQGKTARFAYRGVEPSEAMKAVYRQNFLHRTGRVPLDTWEIATAGLEEFLEEFERYLTHEAANVLVFSYSAHHCATGRHCNG